MRNIRRRKVSRKKFYLKIILISLVVLIILIIFVRIKLFTIKTVDLITENINCTSKNQVKNSISILGQNIFLIKNQLIEKNLKGKFICIRNVNLSKIFPDKIELDIVGRNPIAKIFSQKNDLATDSAQLENIATPSVNLQDGYLIDDEGVIFSKDSNNLEIPRILVLGLELSVGKKFNNNNLGNSLKIIGKIKELGISLQSVVVRDNFLIIFSKPKIIFKLDNIDPQIASLQLILRKAKIESNQLEFIDLRFDKPIVRMLSKKNG